MSTRVEDNNATELRHTHTHLRHVVRKGRNWIFSALLDSFIFFRSVLEAWTGKQTAYTNEGVTKSTSHWLASCFLTTTNSKEQMTMKKLQYVIKTLNDEIFNLQSSREHPDCEHDAGPWQKVDWIHRKTREKRNRRPCSVMYERCLLFKHEWLNCMRLKTE